MALVSDVKIAKTVVPVEQGFRTRNMRRLSNVNGNFTSDGEPGDINWIAGDGDEGT